MKTATVVQTKSSAPTSASTSIALAFDSGVAQNNVIIVGVSYNFTTATNVSSVTDTLGNTYTRINGVTNSTDRAVEMWYAYRTIGGANTVTVNFSSSVTHALILREYSGLFFEIDPFNNSVGQQTTGTSHSSGTPARTKKAITCAISIGGTNYDGNELTVGAVNGNFANVGNATTGMEVAIQDRNFIGTNTSSTAMGTTASISAGVINARFMIDIPTALRRQEVTYSDSSSGTSKNISLTTNVLDRSLLVLVAMDTHTAVNNISGITDTAGNTWQRATAGSSGGGVNGEIWYAYNVKGGNAPTLTVAYSNSVTVAMILREYSGVKFRSDPKDKVSSTVDSVSAYTTTSGLRTSTYQLVIGALAWNSATLAATASALWTDSTTVHNATSNNRVAVAERDVPSAVNTVASWTTTSGTTTVVMIASFHLADYETTTTEDGYTYKSGDGSGGFFTGYDSTGTDIYSFMTSSSSVDPDNSFSAKYFGYWFFEYPELPLNAVIVRLKLHYNVFDAYNDGISNGWYLYTDNTNAIGSTLEYADYDGISTNEHQLYFAPATVGWQEVDLSPSEFTNPAYPLAVMLEHQTGSLTSTYTDCASRENGAAAFLEIGYKINTLAQQGVG